MKRYGTENYKVKIYNKIRVGNYFHAEKGMLLAISK